MSIDTLRILVDWKCNLKCPYCCNEQEHNRSQFREVTMNDIDFSQYANICISGGEPLMFINRIEEVTKRLTANQFAILYSNGILMTKEIAQRLAGMGIKAINIGLHYPKSFHKIIANVLACTENTGISVRFQVWDKYVDMNLETAFPTAKIKYWVMDACDRANEERVVLTN